MKRNADFGGRGIGARGTDRREGRTDRREGGTDRREGGAYEYLFSGYENVSKCIS